MIEISSSLLAKIAGVLAAFLVVLAAYNGTTVKVAVNPTDTAFGAVPVLQSPVVIDGTTEYFQRLTFRTGTSTVVSYKSPAATSTIESVACQQFSGLSFAQEYEIALGNTPNATSSSGNGVANPSFGKLFVPAAGSAAVYATTTSTVVPPNTFINVKMATTSGTTVSSLLAPVGACSIHLMQI